MAYTLFNATLDLARLLGDVIESKATAAGSTTTLKDGNFPRRAYDGALPPNDFYNGGTIWLINCTNTELNGLTNVIADTDLTSGTITFTYAAMAKATAENDQYAVCEMIWPRYKLRQWVGLAMQSIMGDPAIDVSLTTSNAETVDLPTGVFNVQVVEFASSKDTPYYYERIQHADWEEKNGKIYFKSGYWPTTTGYKIRLWYQLPNSISDYVNSDSIVISNYIHPQWLMWEAANHAYRWRKPLDESGKVDSDKLKEAMAMASLMRNKHNFLLPKLPWDVRLSSWGSYLE